MDPLTHRGLTLVETIIAIFILIAGFLVMGAMFHVALQHTARMEARQLAVVLAEKKLEEIKGWSAATHRSTQPFSNWGGLATAIPTTDPDYPGYEIAVTAVAPGGPVLYSPCSQFEAGRSPPRTFTTASVRPVRIEITWSGGRHELVSLVAAPPALPGNVEVTPGPNPLSIAQNGDGDFTAVARDSFGRPLPDSKFRWFVRGGGNVTLTESRDGKTANLLHRIQVASSFGYGSGDCQMVAVGLIGGRRVEGGSGTLTLP